MKNKGFTLIELIVVMAIIAILVLLAAPRFLGYTKDANVTAMKQDTKVLSDAAEMYRINYREWPAGQGVVSNDLLRAGLGGVTVYELDEEELKKNVSSIKGNYTDYGIVTVGEFAGEVFHLEGVQDQNDNTHIGKNTSFDEKWLTEGVFIRNGIDESEQKLESSLNNGLELVGASASELIGNTDNFYNKHGKVVVNLNGYKVIPQIKTDLDGIFWGNERGEVVYQDGQYGRNLHLSSGYPYKNIYPGYTPELSTVDGIKALKWGSAHGDILALNNIGELDIGAEYSFSFLARASEPINLGYVYVNYLNTGFLKDTIVGTNWNLYNFSFNKYEHSTPNFIHMYPKFSSKPHSVEFYLANWKLEKGTMSTPWTPAPEDLQWE